jgi:hypothetical protein
MAGVMLKETCVSIEPNQISLKGHLFSKRMKASSYRISSEESAEDFERKLRDYCEARRIYSDSFGLSKAYRLLTMPCFDPRCFGAYFELCLQDIALQQDIKILCEKTNEEYKSQNEDGFSDNRMARYIASSNVAHRIRAMWDKIMGFIILLDHPTAYQDFINGKSRLSAFKRISKQRINAYSDESKDLISFLSDDLEEIVNNVTSVNDNFRTGEAHSIGRISKWAFAKQVDEDDPFDIMIFSYNKVRDRMCDIISRIYIKAHTRHG